MREGTKITWKRKDSKKEGERTKEMRHSKANKTHCCFSDILISRIWTVFLPFLSNLILHLHVIHSICISCMQFGPLFWVALTTFLTAHYGHSILCDSFLLGQPALVSIRDQIKNAKGEGGMPRDRVGAQGHVAPEKSTCKNKNSCGTAGCA